MMRSLYSGATGLSAQQFNVDTIANNLANVSTDGFKKQRAQFEDLVYQNLRSAGTTSSASGNTTPLGLDVGLGVNTASTKRIFTTGTLRQTNVNTDVAILDKGSSKSFFALALPGGATGYTRDGSFEIDANGELVTKAGISFSTAIGGITNEMTSIDILKDGTVNGMLADGTSTPLGQFQLASFINPAALEAIGGNVYLANTASGAAQTGIAGQGQFGELKSGFIEGSNVSAAEELVNLIVAQRAFEMNSKSIQTSDEMLQTTTNLKR